MARRVRAIALLLATHVVCTCTRVCENSAVWASAEPVAGLSRDRLSKICLVPI